MEERTENQKLSRRISTAYERHQNRPTLKAFKEISRYSRKYGFPLVCTLDDHDESQQISLAARLLLEVAGIWPKDRMPDRLELEPDTALFNDAKQLCDNGLGNRRLIRN